MAKARYRYLIKDPTKTYFRCASLKEVRQHTHTTSPLIARFNK